jgi:hypothetical protein
MGQLNWEIAPSLCALSRARHAKTRPDDSGVNYTDEIPAQHFTIPLPCLALTALGDTTNSWHPLLRCHTCLHLLPPPHQ